MASNPPSGASRLPDILSFCRMFLKVLMLLVRVMTCWKENGGSLFCHGSFSLTDKTGGKTEKWTHTVDRRTDRGTEGARKGELSSTVRQTDNRIDELTERKSH